MKTPTLAIHLNRGVNEKLEFNKETEFLPILGLVNDALNEKSSSKEAATHDVDNKGAADKMEDKHHPLLLAVLADELGCKVEEIHDFEL